ncbi:MAG: GGDEF domain-containing protein [Betaproteobacteria bacterium]|nr:GGDEF domain-containing protein [Betaproteobacteria bacterium]
MKRILAFLTIFLLVCSSKGYGSTLSGIPQPASEKTYRDIPGVTKAEIAAIEALKSARDEFTYGATLATEAFILPDGSYAGFTANLCELLSRLFGIRFVLKLYDWDELISKLESRTVDFTGELSPREGRKQAYRMSFPIAERLLRIFIRADSHRFRTEIDIHGLKIGFLKGAVTENSIKKAYPLSFTHVDVDNYQTAASMIKKGEIDAFVDEAVADPAFEKYDFIRSLIFFPMVHQSVSMATANPELAPIISVLNKYIAAGGVDKLYDIYKEGDFEYAKYKLYKSFTDEEKAYLDALQQRKGAIGVAFEHDNYPVSFYNKEDEEFQGISVDVLAEIHKLTGIRFEAATTKDATWAEIYEKTKAGEVRMAAQLLRSVARREYFIWSSVPYSRSYYAIISRLAYPHLASYQVVRSTVGVMERSGYEDVYRELFPDNDNLKKYDTHEDCLDALEHGEVDLLMASEHMLLSQTNYREKSGFKINIKLNAPMDSYFGFHKSEKILCSIIDKAQQYVPVDVIENTWTGRVFDYSKKLTEERAYFLGIFVSVLLLILLATVFLYVRNVKLGRKLKEMASKDVLTGILNRRYFMELSLMQLERALRAGSECFIVIFDMDYFKTINDNYGHLAGDKVLEETAQRVKKIIRPYDLFARYGGEEFIILMPDIDKANVLNATERIRLDLCREPVDFEGGKIPVSASFGVACAAPMNDIDQATKFADMALYQAKNEGRNRVVFYTGQASLPP